MIRRFLLVLTVLVFLFNLQAVGGEEAFEFSSIHGSIRLPQGAYQTVLTPDNLQANEAFIVSQGGTVVSWAADFAARGILLQAYDPPNDRVLVISALKDVDGQQLFDINEHTADVRAKYRLSHGASGAYAVLGYRYDSVSWKNFANIGRFLQLRYSYRLNGDVERRGYQRRTIRNGYTITVDMQVFGRQLTARDNSALNKVFETFAFSQVLPLPPLPITLDESATAPVETGKASFTMKGKTKPNASLRAVLMSFGTSATKVFEATANKAGSYTLPVELPGEDVYVMTLTVQSEGFDDLSKSYNIRYQQGLIPAQITAAPPAELLENTLILAGQTSESGVKAILYVNGRESSRNVSRDGSFSFSIETGAEGAYDIRLVLTRKGLQDRVFQYKAFRVMSPQAREDLLRQSAISPSYAELSANPDTYDGKMLQFEGTLIQKQNDADSWVLRFALKKTEAGFEDFLILTSEDDPGLAVNSQARVYGQMTGMNIGTDDRGNEEILPKISLSLMAAQ